MLPILHFLKINFLEKIFKFISFNYFNKNIKKFIVNKFIRQILNKLILLFKI